MAEFNFLGLTLDECLNWKPHVQKISNKISRIIGALCRLKNYLPKHILRTIYNSLILSHLQYAVLTWGFKMGRIELLQKRTVRVISSSKYNAHTEPLFKQLNFIKIKNIFELTALKLFYKLKKTIFLFILPACFKIFLVNMTIIQGNTWFCITCFHLPATVKNVFVYIFLSLWTILAYAYLKR